MCSQDCYDQNSLSQCFSPIFSLLQLSVTKFMQPHHPVHIFVYLHTKLCSCVLVMCNHFDIFPFAFLLQNAPFRSINFTTTQSITSCILQFHHGSNQNRSQSTISISSSSESGDFLSQLVLDYPKNIISFYLGGLICLSTCVFCHSWSLMCLQVLHHQSCGQ